MEEESFKGYHAQARLQGLPELIIQFGIPKLDIPNWTRILKESLASVLVWSSAEQQIFYPLEAKSYNYFFLYWPHAITLKVTLTYELLIKYR
jgi:hypothetical protein